MTCLDICLHDLKSSKIIEKYRHEHNCSKHYFSEEGKISTWVPEEKFTLFLKTKIDLLTFSKGQIKEYMKYGFKKVKATVSTKKIIRFDNRNYYVDTCADLFSSHKSTPVKISEYNDRLFIFEPADNGIFIGEALAQKPFEKPVKSAALLSRSNELDKIIAFLKLKNMVVDRPLLIKIYRKGLSLNMTKKIIQNNQKRYTTYIKKMKQPKAMTGIALFNAFILDCQNHNRRTHVAPYASHGEIL